MVPTTTTSNNGTKTCGLILLHGLNSPFTTSQITSLREGMAVNPECVVKAPLAQGMEGSRNGSWFDIFLPPAMSVLSPIAGESKIGLENSLRAVESTIEEMMAGGIPSEKIVVFGFSQGGALTLYTAIHTKYKLGGYLPIVAWLPLRKVEPVYELEEDPTNIDTPILHITGTQDILVPNNPCGIETSNDMRQVFKNYHLKPIVGGHTTLNFFNETKKWIQQNTDIGL